MGEVLPTITARQKDKKIVANIKKESASRCSIRPCTVSDSTPNKQNYQNVLVTHTMCMVLSLMGHQKDAGGVSSLTVINVAFILHTIIDGYCPYRWIVG
jgi:hypothetical protein